MSAPGAAAAAVAVVAAAAASFRPPRQEPCTDSDPTSPRPHHHDPPPLASSSSDPPQDRSSRAPPSPEGETLASQSPTTRQQGRRIDGGERLPAEPQARNKHGGGGPVSCSSSSFGTGDNHAPTTTTPRPADPGPRSDNNSSSSSSSSSIAATGDPTSTLHRKAPSDSDGAAAPTSFKRRRSTRERNRLVVDKSSLFYRRMRELFFDGDPGPSSGGALLARPKTGASSAEGEAEGDAAPPPTSEATSPPGATGAGRAGPRRPTSRRIGHYTLNQVHQCPHVYVIDNFLGEPDLAYFRGRIRAGTFQRSYVDGPASSVDGGGGDGGSGCCGGGGGCCCDPSDTEDDPDDTDARNEDSINNKDPDESTKQREVHDDAEKDGGTFHVADSGDGGDGGDGDDDENRRTARDRSVPSLSSTFVDKRHRTSTFLAFDKQEDAKIATVEKRAAELLGCWSSRIVEPLQLVRYEQGQFFNVHHDLADYDDETGRVELPPKSPFSRRRVVTLFCYLNDVDEGGETAFPNCHRVILQVPEAPSSLSVAADNVGSSTECDACDAATVGGADASVAVACGGGFSTPEHASPRAPAESSASPAAGPIDTSRGTSESPPPPPKRGGGGHVAPPTSPPCLVIRPQPGRAVLWSNVLESGQPDPRTVHAGRPVVRGTKYGVNVWICEGS